MPSVSAICIRVKQSVSSDAGEMMEKSWWMQDRGWPNAPRCVPPGRSQTREARVFNKPTKPELLCSISFSRFCPAEDSGEQSGGHIPLSPARAALHGQCHCWAAAFWEGARMLSCSISPRCSGWETTGSRLSLAGCWASSSAASCFELFLPELYWLVASPKNSSFILHSLTGDMSEPKHAFIAWKQSGFELVYHILPSQLSMRRYWPLERCWQLSSLSLKWPQVIRDTMTFRHSSGGHQWLWSSSKEKKKNNKRALW